MSSDKYLKAVGTISDANFRLGIMVGYEEVAEGLRRESGELFTQGQDAWAKTYRDLAIELEAKAKKAMQEYEARMQLEKEAALRILDTAFALANESEVVR